jgi:hypothetical protein
MVSITVCRILLHCFAVGWRVCRACAVAARVVDAASVLLAALVVDAMPVLVAAPVVDARVLGVDLVMLAAALTASTAIATTSICAGAARSLA